MSPPIDKDFLAAEIELAQQIMELLKLKDTATHLGSLALVSAGVISAISALNKDADEALLKDAFFQGVTCHLELMRKV